MQIPRSASAVLAALTLSAVLVGCGGDEPAELPETELAPPGGEELPPTPAVPTPADPSPAS